MYIKQVILAEFNITAVTRDNEEQTPEYPMMWSIVFRLKSTKCFYPDHLRGEFSGQLK